MAQNDLKRAQLSTLIGIFCLIMMAVFSAEVTVMQVYGPLFEDMQVLQRAFLDASSLVLIIALPLWFFIFSPAFREKIRDDGGYAAIAFSLYVKVLGGLYLIQLLIMLVLPYVMVHLPTASENVVDGTLTIIFSGPLFWWLLYRLELNYRLEPLADFLNAPYTLYVMLLFMIFLADTMQEILFPEFELGNEAVYVLYDALITVLMIAPLLMILVVRPLRRLARSEKARIDAIYDQVVDGIVKINRQGTIQSFNLAASHIFGYMALEMVGKPASLLLNRGQLDLVSAIDRLEDDFEAKPLNFEELSAQRKDGEALVLDLTLSKVGLEGPPEYLLFFQDISDRKAAEDALLATDAIFREIFNQTEDAILFFEPDSASVLDVNMTTELLYGFTKKELQEEGISLFADGDSLKRIMVFLAEITKNGAAQIDRLENRCADARRIIVSLRGKLMTLRGAQVIYCTVRDITERDRLEQESRDIQSKLIFTNKMTSLGLLVSGVAHEINNPNNYVQANAQILSGIWKDAQLILDKYYQEHGDFLVGGIPFSELESQAPDIFHSISDGSRRINAIVNNLKRFVRQDTSKPRASVDMNEVARSAISMLHHELVKHTDEFHADLAEELPPVAGSGQQLGQVIINLLMNACQALPDKTCSVSLSTRLDAEHDEVHILVSDQGCGMPEDAREKILEPFYSTKLESGGTGLGLSISQTIIKEHGGELDFYANSDKGTTFVVKLPVKAKDN